MAGESGVGAGGVRGRAPAELERALKSGECARAIPAEVREKLLKGLLERRWGLFGATCSDAWYDHCWGTGDAFPPPADTTPMRACRCARCRYLGRVWPAYYDAGRDAPDAERDAAAAPPASAAAGSSGTGADRPTAVPATTPPGDTPPDAQGEAAPSLLSYECYLESLDDWAAAQLPSSPSGLALRAIREGRIRLRRGRTKSVRRR